MPETTLEKLVLQEFLLEIILVVLHTKVLCVSAKLFTLSDWMECPFLHSSTVGSVLKTHLKIMSSL